MAARPKAAADTTSMRLRGGTGSGMARRGRRRAHRLRPRDWKPAVELVKLEATRGGPAAAAWGGGRAAAVAARLGGGEGAGRWGMDPRRSSGGEEGAARRLTEDFPHFPFPAVTPSSPTRRSGTVAAPPPPSPCAADTGGPFPSSPLGSGPPQPPDFAFFPASGRCLPQHPPLSTARLWPPSLSR